MKIIIIGLGNFGNPLALYLTDNGHEVFGVDNQMEKVERLKDHIAHVVCMDATNEDAYSALPMKQADLAIVAIGENEGPSIIATAILKRYTHLKIISRSLSDIHNTILDAMGICDIIHPEKDAAFRLTKRISFNYALDYFRVDNKHSIAEVMTPDTFVGKSVKDLDLTRKYKVSLVTIMRDMVKKNVKKEPIQQVASLVTGDTILQKNDILVLFGANTAIMDFVKVKST
ncbi:MAG: TrkA family potassium uptake protein [Flavobacteriales bacterium]